jgi:hypothetical protein
MIHKMSFQCLSAFGDENYRETALKLIDGRLVVSLHELLTHKPLQTQSNAVMAP